MDVVMLIINGKIDHLFLFSVLDTPLNLSLHLLLFQILLESIQLI